MNAARINIVSTATAPRNIARDLHVTYVVTGPNYVEYTLHSSGDNLVVFDGRAAGRRVSNTDTDDITGRLTRDERSLVDTAITAYLSAVAVAREDLGIADLERKAAKMAIDRVRP